MRGRERMRESLETDSKKKKGARDTSNTHKRMLDVKSNIILCVENIFGLKQICVFSILI